MSGWTPMAAQIAPKPGQPCRCGSGKKYKDCCGPRDVARRKAWKRTKKTFGWIGVVAAVVLLVYGVSLTSGVPYGEAEMGVIDFSALDRSEKRTALRAANAARCGCSCGMTLAQCVATDSTCPLRTDNIGKIRDMVDRAKNNL
jgi:hypothetical protein